VLGFRDGAIRRYTQGKSALENMFDSDILNNEPINMISYDAGHRTFIIGTIKAIYACRNGLPVKIVTGEYDLQDSASRQNSERLFLHFS
jgi:hypothetical protein